MQPQIYRVQYDPDGEDIIVNRRKTRLKMEDEFMFDIQVIAKVDAIKRRRFE